MNVTWRAIHLHWHLHIHLLFWFLIIINQSISCRKMWNCFFSFSKLIISCYFVVAVTGLEYPPLILLHSINSIIVILSIVAIHILTFTFIMAFTFIMIYCNNLYICRLMNILLRYCNISNIFSDNLIFYNYIFFKISYNYEGLLFLSSEWIL